MKWVNIELHLPVVRPKQLQDQCSFHILGRRPGVVMFETVSIDFFDSPQVVKNKNKVSQKHVSTVSWNAVESLVCFLKSAKAFAFPDGTLPRPSRGFQNGPACTCVCDLHVSSLHRGVHLHQGPQVSAMNSGPHACSKTGLKTSWHCRSGASVTRNQHLH